jgi:hypothetical protein
VVEVRVGQQHGINRRGLHGKRLPVPLTQCLQALKKAAGYEQAVVANLQKVF